MNNTEDYDYKLFEISWANIEMGTKAIVNNISKSENKPDIILSTQEGVVVASWII